MKFLILLSFLLSVTCFAKENITFFRVKERNELNTLSYKAGIILKNTNINVFSIKKDGIEVLNTEKTHFKKIKVKNGNKFVFDFRSILAKGNYELILDSSKKIYFTVDDFKNTPPRWLN